MHKRLDSLAAIAAHRRECGDQVEELTEPNRVLAGTTYERAPTVAEVRWLEDPAVIISMAMLPMELPTHALTAVALQIMKVNSKSATPGFVLKELPDGFRIAFVAYGFPDADGTISAHALDEVLRISRGNGAVHLPRFAAVVAEASKPKTVSEIASLARLNPKLTKDGMDALREAIAKDASHFVPRLGNAMLAELEQPYFTKTKIFEIVSPAPLPAQTLYLARTTDGQVHVLSGKPDAMRFVAALDAPTDAAGLGHFVSVVTGSSAGT